MLNCVRNCLLLLAYLNITQLDCRADTPMSIESGQIVVRISQAVVEIDLPSGASFRDFTLADPGRIVIDFRGVSSNKRSISKELPEGAFALLRFGQHEDYVRVVLETRSSSRPVYTLSAQPSKLSIELNNASAQHSSLPLNTPTSAENSAEPAEIPAAEGTSAPTASRLSWTRNDIGLILKNSGETTITLDQCAVCTSSCSDLPQLELASGSERGVEASPQARISCILKDSTRSERLLITPQDGSTGTL